ncbi:T9SS type A sorting domain-containing protein [Portibacter lacus]|uniref:Secretion system C-terminal sorting domain-containing protein n=1 Tax=Portibacter lacus TaxID=1099794 RepID=A0AA37WI88_9BACT|nr:T9SS type A sorting domain-containing protein [Portibacter lacus]GLR19380.1 hypothetical protein GCM10007940_39960 [Portibacter lacus]
MKNVLLCFVFCLISLSTYAQSAGAIAIIGINSDSPDGFTFVAIDDIPASTVFFFTDNGVLSDGSLRTGEGIIEYTVGAGGLSQGDVVLISQSGPSASEGVAAVANTFSNINLSASGDQIIAFIGSPATPVYIAAAQTNSTLWQMTASSSNNSALPTGLTDGTTAVAVGSGSGAGDEFDNSEYTGTRGSFADRNAALTTINDASNWTGSNSSITLNSTDFAPLLPVSLTSFSGNHFNNNIELNWVTSLEINNDYFDVQRSANMKDFVTIGKVIGNGNMTRESEYAFTDRNPLAGVNYYRLAQYDFNGDMEFHKVIAVENRSKTSSKVYPTLAKAQLNVEVYEESALTIRNSQGQLINSQILADSKSINISDFAPGIYYLQLNTNGNIETHKFVKL